MFEGLIWIALILSFLLTLGRIFNSDYDDGNLDIILQSNSSLELIICAKYIAYWTTNCLPLILFLPIVGQLFNFTFMETIPLMINLGISSLGMVFIATCISSLTLGAKRTTFLKGIIIIPLYIPFIIFGVSAINSGEISDMMFLSAMSLIAIVIGPVFSSFALKIYYR